MTEIRCEKCNGLISGDSESTFTQKCICPPPENKLTGWICPVCGAGLSPYMSYCPCNNKYAGSTIDIAGVITLKSE